MSVFEWTERTSGFGSSTIYDINTNDVNLWIIVGNNGKLATSPNGIDWTQQDVSAIFTSDDVINTVCYNDSNLWVVASAPMPGEIGTGKIATSANGINWTERIPDVVAPFTSVCHGNGLWVLVSWNEAPEEGTIQTSPDGVNWTQRPYSGNGLYGIEYNGTDLYAAACWYDCSVVTSPDGIIWTADNISTQVQCPWSMRNNQTDLWISDTAYGDIITSPDCVTWDERSTGVFTMCIEHKNGVWLCASEDEIRLSTDDVLTWADETDIPSMSYVCMASDSNMWVVAGEGGILLTGEPTTPDSSKTDLGVTRKTFWLNKTKKR